MTWVAALPSLPAHLCLAPATGLLQGLRCKGLCRKGNAVWRYAAGAMLQESWIMADDDDGG